MTDDIKGIVGTANSAKKIIKRAKTPPPDRAERGKTYTIKLTKGGEFTGTYHQIRVLLKRSPHCESLRYRLDNGVVDEKELAAPPISKRVKKYVNYKTS